eukprot:g30427.t1
MQSPEPRMVVGMGRAFNAFVIVTGLGLVVSGLLLYFPQYAGDACQNCTRGTSIELILPQATTEERLFLLGAGEHVLLIIMYAAWTGGRRRCLVWGRPGFLFRMDLQKRTTWRVHKLCSGWNVASKV